MKLIFATHNAHKLQEVQHKVGTHISIVSLRDLQHTEEIPETGKTLHDNALQKAWHIYELYKHDCFADDTGLEIEALHGLPGVNTARFAGEHCSSDDNIDKTLNCLKLHTHRRAAFKTVIACILHAQAYTFEGVIYGTIAHERLGEEGFGYDPIFIPQGYNESFAQMPLSLKNTISHRALAIEKFVDFLHAQGAIV